MLLSSPMRKALTILLAAILSIGCHADDRPNVIIFLADDLGYGDLSIYGAKQISTPNIDRLADEGIRLTSFYAQPICGPSRAALLTGAYPLRVAEPGNKKHPNTIPHAKEVLLPEVLQSAGYRTAIIGKWHLAGEGEKAWEFAPPPSPLPDHPGGLGPFKPELMPNQQGFEIFFGTPMHNGISREVDNRRFTIELMRNGQVIESPTDNNLLTSKYTKEAISFLRSEDNRPFFLLLSYNAPHTPLGVHPDFEGKSQKGRYGDAVEELDFSVGEITKALDLAGKADNTLIVFLSDNGPETRTVLGSDIGSTGHFRGGKYSNWEGGVRVPAIWWWPDRIPADKSINALTTIMDIYPTLAHLTGAALPDQEMDGHNILPLLREPDSADSPYDVYYYHMLTQLQAVRVGEWKLVLPRVKDSPYLLWLGRYMDTVAAPELYNLHLDPEETEDLARTRPDIVDQLMKEASKARVDLGDIYTIGRRARFFDAGPRRPDTYFVNTTNN